MSLVFSTNSFMWLGRIRNWMNSYIRINVGGWKFEWICLWDLVVCSSTNSYIRISLKQCRWRYTNLYIRNSIIGNSIGSTEEESTQLYSSNLLWQRSKETKSTDGGGESDLNLLLREVEVWKLFGVMHRHMWQTVRQRKQCQKHDEWLITKLATFTNSYINQIIGEKNHKSGNKNSLPSPQVFRNSSNNLSNKTEIQSQTKNNYIWRPSEKRDYTNSFRCHSQPLFWA